MNKPVLKNIGISKVQFGENVTIIEPVNLYGCAIGRNSFIGPFTEIQKDVVIGHDCRIQSHSFICEMVTIGNHCFIGHGVMFINDMMREGRPSGDKTKWEKTRIGNHVTIGSNATILAIEICDNVLIGAGSVVTKNISEAGVYAGNPAKKIEEKK
jgi:acetyltransferase-like isoleucine patch superfamily enzyme